MQTIPKSMTNDEAPLSEYLEGILSQYNEDFREYFYDKCREVINYFANSPAEIKIREWLFHPGNFARFPSSAQSLFDNVEGLSRMTGMSFIKQFNLADKVKRSSRWVRGITSRLKTIALLFSRKTDKINYCFTFDLSKPINEFFGTLVSVIFDHYSDHIKNTININNVSNNSVFDLSSKSPSKSFSKPSARSKAKFSLVTTLYTKLCDKSKQLEAILGSVKKDKSKSKEGMHGIGSQPASHTTSHSIVEEKEEPTTEFGLTENNLKVNSDKTQTATPNETSNPTPVETVETAGTEVIKNQSSKDESNKSIYSYELCEKYTLEYAKFKLGGNDEIDDIKAFASYCYKTGEKDGWISLFIENNYTVTSYNPLKNNDVITSNKNENQNKQHHYKPSNRQSSWQTNSINVENQGKYSINIYLDYIERVERPRLACIGKAVYSPHALAKYMLITGNDDHKIANFVEEMKTITVGARPTDFRLNNFVQTKNGSNNPNSSSKLANEPIAEQKVTLEGLRQDLYNQLRVESLRNELWQNLPTIEQESLLTQEIEQLRASNFFNSHYKRWSSSTLREHAINQIKKRLLM